MGREVSERELERFRGGGREREREEGREQGREERLGGDRERDLRGEEGERTQKVESAQAT